MLFCLFFISYLAPAQTGNPVAVAKIVKEVKNNNMELNATCISQTTNNLSLRYEMEIEKAGNSGTSKNKQSGAFEMGNHETKVLAVNKFNVNKNDQFQVQLNIFQKNKLISKDTLKFTVKN